MGARARFARHWTRRGPSGSWPTTAGESSGYLIGRDVAGSGEVLNLAVVPEQRRSGIASTLLREGLKTLGERGAEEVFLEVRASNSPANELYVRRGSGWWACDRDYYRNPREDALVLRLGFTGLA